MTPQGSPTRWTALPSWRLVTLARHPVALDLPDVAEVEPLVNAGGNFADSLSYEERKKTRSGPGLCLVERDVNGANIPEGDVSKKCLTRARTHARTHARTR